MGTIQAEFPVPERGNPLRGKAGLPTALNQKRGVNYLAPHFGYLFLRGKLGLGPGIAGRFAKAPTGVCVFKGGKSDGLVKSRPKMVS